MKIDKRCLVLLTDMTLGGVTTSAVNFCNGLVERGARVDILLMDVDSDTANRGFSDEIRILRLRGLARAWNLSSKRIRATRNPFKKLGLLALGLVKKIANKKKMWTGMVFGKKKWFTDYDVVVAYRQCYPTFHIALHNVDAPKKVAFIHGDLAFMGDVDTWQPWLKEFDAVAYVSDAVKEGFIRQYPELEKNAVTVYNTFLIDEILRKSQLPCDIVFDRERVNLVTVSRIEHDVKGTGRIAPVCRLLKEKYHGRFHWYVVGDGPDMAACKKQAEELEVTDCLTFLGAKNNPFHYLAQADMCVFPTFTEAFPMVVGESLILGVPVVTTRYPAAGEIIVDGQNGLIVEQSVESIYESVSRLLDDPDLFAELKRNCVAFEYDNDRSYRQFADAIDL